MMKLRLTKEDGEDALGNPKALVPEIELLRDYRRVQLEIGRSPVIADIQQYGKYSASTYIRRYGSWSEFRKSVNNPVITGKVLVDQLIANYYAVKEKLGRVPTGKELGEHGQYGVRTYHKYFGGHRKFLKFLEEINSCNNSLQ